MSDVGRLIIAYCLHSGECLSRCVDELEPGFFEVQESVIFKAIQEHHRKYNNCITGRLLDDQLMASDLSVEEAQEISDIFEAAEDEKINMAEFGYHLDQLKKEHTARLWESMIEGGVDEEGNIMPGLGQIASIDPVKAYEAFKETIGTHMEEIENAGQAHCATLDETADELWDTYEKEEQSPSSVYGVRTGFDFIDQQTLGVHAGEMFLIGGRHGSGKSVFLLNAAVNAYKAGHSVLIVSIEMPRKQYEERFYACYCDLPYQRLRARTLERPQKRLFKEALETVKRNRKIHGQYLHVADIANVTAFTIEAQIKKIIAKCGFKPDLLVVDYLGIMRSIDKSQADWQEQLAVAEELRRLGRIKEIPIISAVQLNRDKKRGKGTERIGRSDGIGATCDVFMQIEESEDEATEGDANMLKLDDTVSVYIAKNRNGESDRSFGLFKNYANMIIKNKDTFKPKVEVELDAIQSSLDTMGVDELQAPMQEAPEDKTARENGDFISGD